MSRIDKHLARDMRRILSRTPAMASQIAALAGYDESLVASRLAKWSALGTVRASIIAVDRQGKPVVLYRLPATNHEGNAA